MVEEKEGLLTKKEVYPKKSEAELEGYKMTVKCFGLFSSFSYEEHQRGDPKGSISVKGPGVRASLGNRLVPRDLRDGRDLVVALGDKLVSKYRREPNWDLLHELGEKTLTPFVISNY